ncbi:actin-like ATPase domain-containing protein [Rhizophagus irregularis]|uniref:Actin-like ATPase domain-containing protein n=1 Tax=Rhizophagus irregularis TaxID=588596 RepID=A0A2N0QDU8_9GLOM|nr:actin-like ATPase domain-containing protein [Rhizophagus irregularis]
MSWLKEVRVVVGFDFGTTYSGFTLYHVDDDDIGDIKTNSEWPGELGKFKTNTVLQYKEDFEEVELWGYPALYKKPNRRSGGDETKPVELFKLQIGNCLEKFKPKLPEPLTYKQAITDYLFKIGELIKETIPKYWTGIDFMEHILLVLTVPAGYSENDKAIMRECTFNAGLISDKRSERLQFTTEPEAAAIYCMYSSLKEHKLTEPGTTFMIVDCGGGTVDLTTRKLLEENQLGEVTRRAGDFCGSTFIDNEFIELLKCKVGNSAVDLLREEHYGQLQYLVQEFCQNVKLPFTGNNPDFSYEIDLEEIAPALLQYVTGLEKIFMEEKEWMIQLDFNTIKSMFDPIIGRIIGMIRVQLDNSSEKCSAIFLVGGFSQSKYLQKRIEKEFGRLVENISVPNQPIAAVVSGAAIYGKSLQESKNLKSMNNVKCVIATRVMDYTFGVLISCLWKDGDPLDRLTSDGRIDKFLKIVKCDDIVTIDQEFTTEDLVPIYPDQTTITFDIYYTREQDADYCNEPGMKLLGSLLIDLPEVHLGTNRPCTFCLSFGDMEIKARAFNQTNGQHYQTKFEFNTFKDEESRN